MTTGAAAVFDAATATAAAAHALREIERERE